MRRGVLIVLGALAAFIVVLIVIDRVSPTPEGPPSSSYATSPGGVAAYAALLDRAGVPVRRLRTPIADRTPRDGETLMILDPSVMEPEEADAVRGWVEGGGRLVLGSSAEPGWLDQLLDEPPLWASADVGTSRPLVPLAGVRVVEGRLGAELDELGGVLPMLDPPIAATTGLGLGEIVLLANTFPLTNRGLDEADNAAFGLALAGDGGVAFLETVHGYGVSRGFGGLPTSVKWTLLGLLLTSLVAVWTAGRRFGPPEDPDTEPPPPRVEYVDALASSLARTKENS
ncbi:DUF4350 domain-containing protein [Solirubrobacter sp. CPCC 204708]|uniref:DUF4350 domain-containing protein n=1 Tax=Solirubrobacter deserti TaxID=2282478 RepID=A0ABT4RNL5_9ACTN|nr:DUF4350 domain-containing protein [Solirubrobacter deserti]MBE2320165.1 DUF4350 domain-containing protein [Solirubrobacter deserti]MDA0139885.1 DUF4350 domain-containing protein [Solirubrobacter deserti]